MAKKREGGGRGRGSNSFIRREEKKFLTAARPTIRTFMPHGGGKREKDITHPKIGGRRKIFATGAFCADVFSIPFREGGEGKKKKKKKNWLPCSVGGKRNEGEKKRHDLLGKSLSHNNDYYTIDRRGGGGKRKSVISTYGRGKRKRCLPDGHLRTRGARRRDTVRKDRFEEGKEEKKWGGSFRYSFEEGKRNEGFEGMPGLPGRHVLAITKRLIQRRKRGGEEREHERPFFGGEYSPAAIACSGPLPFCLERGGKERVIHLPSTGGKRKREAPQLHLHLGGAFLAKSVVFFTRGKGGRGGKRSTLVCPKKEKRKGFTTVQK